MNRKTGAYSWKICVKQRFHDFVKKFTADDTEEKGRKVEKEENSAVLNGDGTFISSVTSPNFHRHNVTPFSGW